MTAEPPLRKREFSRHIERTSALTARLAAQDTFTSEEELDPMILPHTMSQSNSVNSKRWSEALTDTPDADETVRLSFDEDELNTPLHPEITGGSFLSIGQVVPDPVDYETYLQDCIRDTDAQNELQVLWDIPKDNVVVSELLREQRLAECPYSVKSSEQQDQYFRFCSQAFLRDWSVAGRTYGTFNGFEGFNKTRDRTLLCRRTPSFINDKLFEFSYPIDAPGGDGEDQGSSVDPVLNEVIDVKDWADQDDRNMNYRKLNRHSSIFSIYPRKVDIRVEPRTEAKIPTDHTGTKLKIHVIKFEMVQKFEPLFGTLYLYDTREKRRISENLYFDFNEEDQLKMVMKHVVERAYETKAHAGIFSITNLHPDVFIVIRIDKVLEGVTTKSLGDIYASEKVVKSAQLEKLHAAAVDYCDRLGKYRMPFAWYCVSMAKIFETKLVDRDADRIPPLDGPFHCTVKIQCLILQEPERLREEDLHKFCQELKRYEASAKSRPRANFEYIKTDIAIEVSTLVETDLLCVFSSNYSRVIGPKEVRKKYRPVREVEEFPAKEITKPSVSYTNLLYIYPQSLNLSNTRTNTVANPRNITVRVLFLTHEDPDSALNVIYGKSNTAKFYNESYSAVSYHTRTPDFYEEVKIDLPTKITEFSHLLFQFFHITCQKPRRREDEAMMSQFIGVTWLPIIDLKTGMINVGEFNLPISSEFLPKDYSRSSPEIPLPSVKWMDGHKSLFRVTINLQSTVYPLCSVIHNYLTTSFWADKLESEPTPTEVVSVIKMLPKCEPEQLFKFSHILFDTLFKYLIIEGPIAANTFVALSKIIHHIHLKDQTDEDPIGRNQKLTSYIHFVFRTPRPTPVEEKGTGRFMHEVLVDLWLAAEDKTVITVHQHAWFYFELTVKAIVQYLNQSDLLKEEQSMRFSKLFLENLLALVKRVTESIIDFISSQRSEVAQQLSLSLAYFIHDLITVIDRTCILNMVKIYFRRFIQSTVDQTSLIKLKIEFLHVICLHEYYVQMNLPMPDWWMSKMENQYFEELSLGAYSFETEQQAPIPNFLDLTETFFTHHYLVGILLSTLSYVLSFKMFPLKSKMVSLVKDLLESHDTDIRYGKLKSFVAYLYLPLIGIVIDSLPIIYNCGDRNTRGSRGSAPRPTSVFNFHGAMTPRHSVIIYPNDTREIRTLDPQTSKDLLFCVVWVLKNIDFTLKHHIFLAVSVERLEALLHILDLCLDSFEYPGVEAMSTDNLQIKPSDQMRQNLAQYILGQGSAVDRLRQRRAEKHQNPPSNGDSGTERWVVNTRSSTLPTNKESRQQFTDGLADTRLHSNLSTEVSLVILDFLEALVQEDYDDDDPYRYQPFLIPTILPNIIHLYLHFLRTNQSTYLITCVCSSLRSLILKYPDVILFQYQEQCSFLCKDLLHLCSSGLIDIRQQATATLYTIMREHFILAGTFSYVKVQITSALSSIVGELVENEENSHDEYLRRSLNTLSKYARVDHLRDLCDSSSFPDQVASLSLNLLVVIDDTSKLRACGSDSDLLLDLMYRIAKGYQNSPDLRLAWLENMMNKNKEEGNYAEAGMCLVHAAAMIAEYLGKISPKPYMPIGAISFVRISSNVIEESAVSEDTVSAKEEGVCNGQKFSEEGLLGLLKLAHHSFEQAQLFESVIEIDKVIIPILEHNREYSKLSRIHETMQNCYRTMDDPKKDRKYFTSYYRVKFFGLNICPEQHGKQFIYKCNTICKLSEFTGKIETNLKQNYGEDCVKLITDSNEVNESKLSPNLAYVQITYVEPYFDDWELYERTTDMERSFNITRFSYSTPFTQDGKPHGEPAFQYMRRTILTTYNSFPYLMGRVSVMNMEAEELTPIELGIEEIKKQTNVLRQIIDARTQDMVLLDMRLSGAVATTVNQGPMAIARAFLTEDKSKEIGMHQRLLRIAFKQFLQICETSLNIAKDVNREDRIAYQRNLEKNFQAMKKELKPLIESSAARQRHKPFQNRMLDRISGVGDQSKNPM